MPQLKLAIGQMDLERDNSSTDDFVSAQLYNGYRVGSSFYGIQGTKSYLNLGTNVQVDGDYYSSIHNVRIAVSNGKVFTISGGVKTEIAGTSLTIGTSVSFTEDKNAIFFAANSNIHKLASGVLTVMAGQSPINVTSLAYISGFLIAKGDDSAGSPVAGDLWYSDDTGYATWGVFNNEALPDALQCVLATFNEVYAIGMDTIEVSYLSSDAASPFSTNKAAVQPFGTMAPYSVAFDKQSIYMLTEIGGNRRIAKLIGGRDAQIISFSVDVPIDDIADVSNAKGWIEGFKGQTFYVINFPTANITICDQVHESLTLAFNIRSEEWDIWGEYGEGNYKRHPANTFLYIESEGKRYVGGTDGIIYELDPHTFMTGATATRTAIRTGWRSWGKLSKKKFCNAYFYDMKRGGESDVTEPYMIHRWRNDGSAEWTQGRMISLGKVGERRIPQVSRGCGSYYKRQDEFIFSEPGEIIFNGVEEDFEMER